MKVFIIREKSGIKAEAEYNFETKECKVLKGSIVSETVTYSEKFRGAASIEKAREGKLKGSTVIKDVVFKSASTAANFVTGNSTNGLTAWKNKDGKSIKDIIKEGANE